MLAEEFLDSYQTQLRREAEGLISQPMPELTESLFALFETDGNRLTYESVYFTRRKFLTILGLQAIEEYGDSDALSSPVLLKLDAVIREVCSETCWALPAHVDRKQPDWQITIDLFAAETGQTLSELADRLQSKLPEETYQIIIENVERRILRPFLAVKDGYGWEKSDHNWNAVCCGSIGSICLHLMREREDILRPCLERVCASLPFYLGGFAEDGVCMEGLGYYFYGMSYFVNFAQELDAYTGGTVDIWGGTTDKNEKIAAFWNKCYFSSGRTVNFSDSSDRTPFQAGLALALRKRFPQVEIPDFRLAADLNHDNCYRFVFRKMDLLETRAYLARGGMDSAPHAKRSFTHLLPDAQWCIAEAENGVGFACKGGSNGEPHNHNDIGHFLYEAKGTVLLADLGAGEYTAAYFGAERYGILCNSSLGHSVPLVAGQGQHPGKAYRCHDFEAKTDAGNCQIVMELAGAYEADGLQSLRRTLSFSLTDGRLLVEDVFQGPVIVTENLITQYRPILQSDGILLRGETASVHILIAGIDNMRDVTVLEHTHSNHAGELETVYALRWELRQGKGRFIVITEDFHG